jgi:hypothetical protein
MDTGGYSYTIDALTLNQGIVTTRELFRRICFNALISKIDDHPRNHALIRCGSFEAVGQTDAETIRGAFVYPGFDL